MPPVVVNPTVAVQAKKLLMSQRVVVSGVFNSHGFRSNGGLVRAIQNVLVASGVKIFGCGPITFSCSDSSSGSDNQNAACMGSLGGSPLGWARQPTGTGSPGLFAPTTKVKSLTPAAMRAAYPAAVTNQYEFGRGNDGASVQYNGIYRPLAWSNNTAAEGGADAATTAANCDGGFFFQTDNIANPLYPNRNEAWTLDIWTANASPNGGTFMPGSVVGSVPNVSMPPVEGDTNVVIAAGTATGMVRNTRTWTAAVRDSKWKVQVQRSAGLGASAPTGNVFFGYQVMWETNTVAGAIVAPLMTQGGWSVYDFANCLGRVDGDQMRAETVRHFLEVLTRPALALGQKPAMLFFIAEGSNTASETSTSFANGYTAASTAAYQDDVIFVIKQILSAWTTLGYDPNLCLFCLHADHPRKGALNTKQADYRATGMPYVASLYPNNVFGINSDSVWTYAKLLNGGVSNSTILSGQSATQTATATSITSGGLVTVTVSGAWAVGDDLTITTSNATPSINGIHTVSTVPTPGTNFTIALTGITGAGTTATVRALDGDHLAAGAGDATGGTLDGYTAFFGPLWAGVWAADLQLVPATELRGRGSL